MSPCKHRARKAHFCTCFPSEEHLEFLNTPMKNNRTAALAKMQRYLCLALLSLRSQRKWISSGRGLTKAPRHYTCIKTQVASKWQLKCHAIPVHIKSLHFSSGANTTAILGEPVSCGLKEYRPDSDQILFVWLPDNTLQELSINSFIPALGQNGISNTWKWRQS